jgi:hypothetical protein
MWYCSGIARLNIDGKLENTYDIKYARSADGISWVSTDVNEDGFALMPTQSTFPQRRRQRSQFIRLTGPGVQ